MAKRRRIAEYESDSQSIRTEVLRSWRQDPALWVNDHVDIKLARYRSKESILSFLRRPGHSWLRANMPNLTFDAGLSYQGEALRRMAKPGYYAYQWANGCAKTTTLALWILWFLDCYPGGKVVTTAGTWSQLTQQLWREIAMWNERSHDTIVSQVGMNKHSIEIAPDWFAFARAANSEETFEGVHGQHVAVIMDEAKAIKDEVFNAVRRILRGNAGGNLWWVCASSPGSPSGPFFNICTGADTRWHVFKMSAYQSERVDLEQIESDAEDLGESSPLFVSMDLGEFPEEADDTIIPLTWVQAAVERAARRDGKPCIGVDVARYGNDSTVFMQIDGRVAEITHMYQGKDLMKTANRCAALAPIVHKVGIDDAGLGGGVVDRLRELEVRNIVPLNAGEKARDSDRFANAGTEWMWNLRKAFEDNYKGSSRENDTGEWFSIPNHKTLIHQLAARKFDILHDGRVRMETKQHMKERGEKSPDMADAMAMAYWVKRRSVNDNAEVFRALADAKVEHKGVNVYTMKF